MTREIRRYQQTLKISDLVGRDVGMDSAWIFKFDFGNIRDEFEKLENSAFIVLDRRYGREEFKKPKDKSGTAPDERLYLVSHVGYSVGYARDEITFQDYIKFGKPKTIERVLILSTSD